MCSRNSPYPRCLQSLLFSIHLIGSLGNVSSLPPYFDRLLVATAVVLTRENYVSLPYLNHVRIGMSVTPMSEQYNSFYIGAHWRPEQHVSGWHRHVLHSRPDSAH